MKVYLDTVLVSALEKKDLKPEEQQALSEIYAVYKEGMVELTTSVEVEDELKKIPDEYRDDHIDIYNLFNDVPRVEVGGITRLGPLGFGVSNPRYRLMEQLKDLLPGENDARHIFTTAANKMEYFLTADVKTILKHASEIKAISGVQALRPSEFLDKLEKARRLE
jgi:hypothetical protein